jgi:hypothetical protein
MRDLKKFIISDTQYLKINPNECIHEDECQFCAQIDMDYIDTKNNVCIRFGYKGASDFYYYIAESDTFKKLIKGTHILDISIINDIGFEWNEYFANKKKSTKVNQYHWVSNSHKGIRPYYSSWLYNNEQGNIIFEVTPFYPWFHNTKKTCPDKISYKEWIKSYNPAVKTIIPNKNLKKWITQAKKLGKIYKLNLF